MKRYSQERISIFQYFNFVFQFISIFYYFNRCLSLSITHGINIFAGVLFFSLIWGKENNWNKLKYSEIEIRSWHLVFQFLLDIGRLFDNLMVQIYFQIQEWANPAITMIKINKKATNVRSQHQKILVYLQKTMVN